jgi:hypothetical protein
LHPGGILTPLAKHLPGVEEKIQADEDMRRMMKNTAQGAATTVWAAVAKELEGVGGFYLDEVAVAERAQEGSAYYTGTDSQPWLDTDNGCSRHLLCRR